MTYRSKRENTLFQKDEKTKAFHSRDSDVKFKRQKG